MSSKNNRHQKFIESSQFGSLPPKVVTLFVILIVIYVFLSSVAYRFIEDWSYLDALYFAIVTISTVGYGDIVPKTSGGRVLNILFTLISFCGIFLLFRVIIGYVVDHQIAAIVRRIQIRKKLDENNRSRWWGVSPRKKTDDLDQMADDAQEAEQQEQDADFLKTRNLRWVIHLILYCVWLFVWCMFYTLHPKEDFTVFEALYFGIITSTTIGYGAKEDGIPRSNEGKLFCLITTMFGTLSLAILAGSLSQGFLAILRGCFKGKKGKGGKPSTDEQYRQQLEKLLELPKSGKGSVDRFDFVCNLLVSGGKCKKNEIQRLMKEFDKLDVNGDGVLDEKDFQIYKQETLDLGGGGGRGGLMDVGYGNNYGGDTGIQMANIESISGDDSTGLR